MVKDTRKRVSGIPYETAQKVILPHICVRYISTGTIHRVGSRYDDLLYLDSKGGIQFVNMSDGGSTESCSAEPPAYEFVCFRVIHKDNPYAPDEYALTGITHILPMMNAEAIIHTHEKHYRKRRRRNNIPAMSDIPHLNQPMQPPTL